MPSPRPDGSEGAGSPVDAARIEALLDLRRWDEATRLAGELVAQRPGDARVLVLQSRALHGAGRNADAVRAARAARAAQPSWDEPLRVEAWALAKDQPRSATAAARGARDRNPQRLANWTALSYLAAQSGELGEAAAAAEQARVLGPHSAEAMNVSGVVALKRKQNPEAERWFRAGLAVDPNSPHLMNNLALALRNQGRGDEAMALFERSLVADPHDPRARHNLGATVRQEIWSGAARWVLLVGLGGLWFGSVAGNVVVTVAAVAAIFGAIGSVLLRRRRITEGRRSALRDYERIAGPGGSSGIFKDRARRRRVIILVGWILALTVLLVVGTRVEGERPSLRPTSGP